jgi:hypothetical protein
MLHERMAIRTLLPSRPPDDLYEAHAREIAQAVLPQPEPCCADQECSAYAASMRWWRVQIGLRRSTSALNDLIDDHDAKEGANCLCENLRQARLMRGALVRLWERIGELLAQMRAQAEAQDAAEKGDG